MTVTSKYEPVDRTDRGIIKAWVNLHRIPAIPDQESSRLLANRCQMIAVDPADLRGFEGDIRSINGRIVVALWGYASAVEVGQVPPSLDPLWFLKDAGGQRVVRPDTETHPKIFGVHPSTLSLTLNSGQYPLLYNGTGKGKTWKQWIAVAWKQGVDALNTIANVPSNFYNGYYLDVGGLNGLFDQPINPDTGNPFTTAEWIALLNLMADNFRNYTTIPADGDVIPNVPQNFLIAQGLQRYQSTLAGTASPVAHVSQSMSTHHDMLVMDRFLSTGGPNDWPSALDLENVVNAMIKTQEECWVAVSEKAWNFTWTTADYQQWRRLSAGAWLLGNRGRAMWEFNRGFDNALYPWPNGSDDNGELNADIVLYTMNLGRPLPSDTPTFASSTNPAAAMRVPGKPGLYRRRYISDATTGANGGIVLLNITGGSITYVADRSYKSLNQAVNYSQGAAITVPAHTALILIAVSGSDNTPPVLNNLTPDTLLAADATDLDVVGDVTDGSGVGMDFVEVDAVRVVIDPTTGHFTRSVPVTVGQQKDVVVHAEDIAGNIREAIIRATRPATPAPATIPVTSPTQGQVFSASTTSITLAGTVSLTGGASIVSSVYSLDRGPAVALVVAANAFSQPVSINDGPHSILITITDSNGQVARKSVSFSKAFTLLPVSIEKPSLIQNDSGYAWEVGKVVKVVAGTWDNMVAPAPGPFTFLYDILRVDPDSPETILATVATDVAAGATYTIVSGGNSKRLRVREKATNANGTSTRLGDPSPIVRAAPSAAPTLTGQAPGIRGSLQVGRRIDFQPGNWTDLGGFYRFTYQLERNDGTTGSPIWTILQTSDVDFYILGSSEAGHEIRLGVQAENSAGQLSATFAYSAISTVLADAPTLVDAPHTYGSFYQGEGVAVTLPTYVGSDPLLVNVQWYKALYVIGTPLDALTYAPITGATNLDYMPGLGDVDYVLRPRFTAQNIGGTLVSDAEPIGPIQPARVGPGELPESFLFGSFASRLLDELEPLAYADDENQSALRNFVGTLGWMFQKLEDLSSDTETDPGWAIVFDPDHIPTEGLGWLGQFVGVKLENRGVDEDPLVYWARQRIIVKSRSGFQRGTPEAIRAAAQANLSGAGTVILRERSGGAYRLSVTTYTGQTPDPALVASAIRGQKPAGIVLSYQALEGHDYQFIADHNTDYDSVLYEWVTYDGMAGDDTSGVPPTPPPPGSNLPGSGNLPDTGNLPGA